MKKNNQIDFERFCRDNNLDHLTEGHHHCSTGWIQLHCPFCSGGNYGYHMGYSLEKGNFSCWRCGGKKTWDVFGRLLGTSDKKVIGRTLRKYETDAKRKSISLAEIQRVRKRKCPEPPDLQSLMKQHKKYLRKRGFNPRKLQKYWNIKATGPFGLEWKWRVVAPVYDLTGQICAYNGRIIREGIKPPYRFTANKDITVDPESVLYGLNQADFEKGAVIVEGMFDVWRMGPGCVGVFGIKWTEQQANILRNFKRRFIMFDPEPEAQKQAQKLARWLSVFKGETEIITGLGCDPGDLPQKEADNIMRELDLR